MLCWRLTQAPQAECFEKWPGLSQSFNSGGCQSKLCLAGVLTCHPEGRPSFRECYLIVTSFSTSPE